jgi:hypothetical protein
VGTIVVGGVALWIFGGLFSHVFHLFEYAVVAVVAGWIGYKMGHAQGRHEHEHDH